MKDSCKEIQISKDDKHLNSQLSDDDILRYSRQILLPDIGIDGQKFLMSSIIYIDAQELYYLQLQKQFFAMGLKNFTDDEKKSALGLHFFSYPNDVSSTPRIIITHNDNICNIQVLPPHWQNSHASQPILSLPDDPTYCVLLSTQLVVNILIKLKNSQQIIFEKYSFQIPYFHLSSSFVPVDLGKPLIDLTSRKEWIDKVSKLHDNTE